MKLEESRHEARNNEIHHESANDQCLLGELGIITGKELIIKTPLDRLVKVECHADCGNPGHDEDIYQKEQEVFAIPEANAIVDPRTMVVHVQNTPIACRTVVASFGFEDVAHEAIPPTLVLVISKMESPKHRDLARVCSHGLKERPKKHEE